MITRNQTRRGDRHLRLFGSLGLLAAALLLHACSENVSPEKSSGGNSVFLRGDAPGVSFAGVDQSLIRGFGQADLRYLRDTRLGDEQGVYYYGMLADANGAIQLTSATANETRLKRTEGATLWDGYSLNGSVPGGTVQWDMRAANGVFLPPSTLQIPERPTIVSPAPYAAIPISQGLNVGISSHVDGGDAIVMIVYDSYRDSQYGQNQSPVDGPSVRTRYFTRDDDGNLELSAEDLQGISPGRIYNLVVYRWRYDTYTRSDGEKVGLAADVQYAIPVMFTN